MTDNEFSMLPTGKPHVSFSEISDWVDCSWRHKLRHVEGIDLSTYGVALDNGTGLHSSCEDFLRTRVMNVDLAVQFITEAFERERDAGTLDEYLRTEGADYDEFLTEYIEGAKAALNEVPAFMDETFKDWEFIDAEHALYEPIENHNHAFKGFIDGIIKCTGARGKKVYWLIDWKTSARGWFRDKRSDEKTKQQLILYKNFWAKKKNIEPKDIRCGFVLLKRQVKPGQHCELIPVSVGNVSTGRALQVINNMFYSLDNKIAVKNRLKCRWCDYKGTKHCSGSAIAV